MFSRKDIRNIYAFFIVERNMFRIFEPTIKTKDMKTLVKITVTTSVNKKTITESFNETKENVLNFYQLKINGRITNNTIRGFLNGQMVEVEVN